MFRKVLILTVMLLIFSVQVVSAYTLNDFIYFVNSLFTNVGSKIKGSIMPSPSPFEECSIGPCIDENQCSQFKGTCESSCSLGCCCNFECKNGICMGESECKGFGGTCESSCLMGCCCDFGIPTTTPTQSTTTTTKPATTTTTTQQEECSKEGEMCVLPFSPCCQGLECDGWPGICKKTGTTTTTTTRQTTTTTQQANCCNNPNLCPSNQYCDYWSCTCKERQTTTTTSMTTPTTITTATTQPGVTCTCDITGGRSPRCGGTSPYNHFRCTDGTDAYCAEWEECRGTQKFPCVAIGTPDNPCGSSTSTTTSQPTTTSTRTTTTTTQPSTTTISGPEKCSIKFDKRSYQQGETATVNWEWSNIDGGYQNIYGQWIIVPETERQPKKEDYLHSSTGSDSTTVVMDTNVNWIAYMNLWDSQGARKSDCRDTVSVKGKQTEKCKNVVYNGDNKIDIVFLGDKYMDLSTFESDVNTHTNKLFSTVPFSTYSNRFDVWRVDEITDLGCELKGRCYSCDAVKALSLASQCKNDYVIVLVKGPYGGCSGRPATSSSETPSITVHEFGHSFGNLDDEYEEGAGSDCGRTPSKPNCDVANCPKWTGTPGTGCYKLCSIGCTDWYRPTENDCLMRTGVDHFCPVCERHLEKVILSGGYSSSISTYKLPEPYKIYFLELNYNKGVITLKNISMREGFAPDRNIQPTSGYKMDTISKSETSLQSFILEPPTKLFYDYMVNGQFTGGVIERNNFDFVEIVPYYENAKSINLYNPQNVTTSFADISSTAKNGLTLVGNNCQVGSDCQLNLLGCNSGLWISEIRLFPFAFPIINPNKPLTRFIESSTTLKATTLCFSPLSVNSYSLEMR
jgi:hypothetical protein